MAGRKPLYHTAEEMPVTCSLRVPRGLYDETQQYVSEHRLSLTEFLLDAIRLRLDTPADPRDIQVSDKSNTIVLQELQALVDAAVEAALAKREHEAPPVRSDNRQPARDDILYNDNNTVIQELLAVEVVTPSDDTQYYDNNTVIQEEAVPVSGYGAGIAAVRAAALERQVFSCAELAAALGRPAKAVHQDLHKLVKEGLLVHEGSQRQARYRVTR